MTYEETPRKSVVKTTVKQLPKPNKKQPKQETKDMNKDQYTKTKAAHKLEIKTLKQDIKKHKLLIKQARIVYKITKMKGSK